jgi:hypothetical protein
MASLICSYAAVWLSMQAVGVGVNYDSPHGEYKEKDGHVSPTEFFHYNQFAFKIILAFSFLRRAGRFTKSRQFLR